MVQVPAASWVRSFFADRFAVGLMVAGLAAGSAAGWAARNAVVSRSSDVSLVGGILVGLVVAVLGLGLAALAHDVSERRRFSAGLAEAQVVWDVAIAFWVSAPGGKLIRVNQAFADMFGFDSPEAVSGFDSLRLWAKPSDRREAMRIITRDDGVSGYELDMVRLDGSVFPVRASVRVDPESGALLGTLEDVTAEREARHEIAVTLARFRSLFESSPVAMRIADLSSVMAWLIDLRHEGIDDLAGYLAMHPGETLSRFGSGTVTAANQAASDLFGVGREELLGTVADVPGATATSPEGVIEALAALGAGSLTVVFDGEVSRSDGTLRHVRFQVFVPSVGGQPDYQRTVVAYVDVTEIEDARRLAVDLAAMRSQLVATVAHELRTPLTAVVGFSDLLENRRSEMAGDEVEEMVGMIASTGRQMTGIVEDLLASARVELGQLRVDSAEVLVAVEARAALQAVDLGGREVSVVGGEVLAWADGGRVRQIVRNLVSNAVRHGAGLIRIEVFSRGGEAVLWVSDQGAGVPADQVPQMFGAYWVGRGAGGHAESVGLGLNLSRNLARLMGGDLVYRRIKEETVLELSLPSTAAPDDPGQDLA